MHHGGRAGSRGVGVPEREGASCGLDDLDALPDKEVVPVELVLVQHEPWGSPRGSVGLKLLDGAGGEDGGASALLRHWR